MTTKLGLTFGIIIAHFIPGLIVLLSLSTRIYDVECLLKFTKDNTSLILSLSPFLSLALGLLLDALRYLLTWIPRLSKSYRKWHKYDISKSKADDRKYHDWIIEHNFRFHQFYGNLGLGLLVSAILSINELAILHHWLLYIFLSAIICLISAALTYYNTIDDLRNRFPSGE
jgi:hypothetical protein